MLGRSIRRFVRSIVALFSFGFIKLAEPIENNPQIIGMELEDIQREEQARLGRIVDALGRVRGQVIGIENQIKAVNAEILTLETEKDGNFALMDERTKKLKSEGVSEELIFQDPEFAGYHADYNDCGSTIAAKKAHLETLKMRLKDMNSIYEEKLLEVQEIKSHINSIGDKKNVVVATMEMNSAFEQIAKEFGQIGDSGSSERLARIDRITLEAQGRAETTARVAGTDSKVRSLKARKAAQKAVMDQDLLARLGMGKDKPSQTPASPEAVSTKLPEA
jgi:chromosome segregation ATPase